MPTRSGNPYLLGETNESYTTPMDPQQFATVLIDIQDKLDVLTQTSNWTEERLVNLETVRKPTPHCNQMPSETPNAMYIIMMSNTLKALSWMYLPSMDA